MLDTSVEDSAASAQDIASNKIYGEMMLAIKSAHSSAQMMQMVKLPLMFTDAALYAGAVSLFKILLELRGKLRP